MHGDWQGFETTLGAIQDMFAFNPLGMQGTASEAMEHKLTCGSKSYARDKTKCRRGSRSPKALATRVHKEMSLPEWVSNVVFVKKKPNGTWRMCVDFTDSNKAAHQDSYSLSKIDKLVDSTTRHKLIIFMDYFSSNYLIPPSKKDHGKTAIIIHTDMDYYNVMSFGWINAGATNQQLVNKIFAAFIEKKMQVYMDDMITRSVKETNHVRDLEETFKTIRHYEMKLNPRKCTSRVRSLHQLARKFLGYIIEED